MRAPIQVLFTLIVLFGALASEAQAARRQRAPVQQPVSTGLQYGCTEHRVHRNELARPDTPGTATVAIVLPASATQGLALPENKVPRFTVSIRAPHTAARKDLNGWVKTVHRCIFGQADASNRIVPTESLMYTIGAGLQGDRVQNAFTGFILLSAQSVASQPRITTVLANNVELVGRWMQTTDGRSYVRLEPVHSSR